ncbi:MAG: hypothetical protein WBW48_08955 [Anaerolineae bacterium]
MTAVTEPSIRLNPHLITRHITALRRYLSETRPLTGKQWRTLFKAVDLLSESTVRFRSQEYTFSQFYAEFVDRVHASSFLDRLYRMDDIHTEGERLRAAMACSIAQWLKASGLDAARIEGAEFLLIFSLYWWTSFCRGYMFELTVFRDLEASGIQFIPHNPRLEEERYAPNDFYLGEFRGDVKSSIYFLEDLVAIQPTVDLYISRLYDSRRRRYQQVVFMKEQVWRCINGDTIPGTVPQAPDLFPRVISFTIRGQKWVLAEYDMWKARVLQFQAQTKGEEQ